MGFEYSIFFDKVEEKRLLLALRNSDEAAFKKLFERFYPKVKSFLVSCNLKNDLDDVLQETFISVWKRREHIDLDKSFDSYIFTIAKNYALKNLRKRIIGDIRSSEIEINDTAVPIDRIVDVGFYDEKIQSSINSLPPRSKAVFQMKRYEGLSTLQIAQKLGIAPKTVENYMHKALTTLKKELEHLAWLILVYFL